MAYIVNKTNGNVVATVADGTIDLTSTSIGIIGRHYPNYGETVAENFVKMLENFSNSTPPPAPLKGQLWFDSSSNTVNVNVSDNPLSPQWLPTTKIPVSSTEPLVSVDGTVWYDTTVQNMKVKIGSDWTPLKTIKTGELLPSVNDAETGDIFYNSSNNQTYVFTNSGRFSNNPEWESLGIRYAPVQPSDIKDGELWYDSDTRQLKLFSEAVTGANPAGSEVIGPIFPKTIPYDKSGTFGTTLDDRPVIVEMLNGVPITLMSYEKFTQTGGTVDGINFGLFPSVIEKGINLTTSNDSASNPPLFNGTASSVSADIAEKYESDVDVEPGDLLKIGGSKEVTKTNSSLDQHVFGVVSTSPAYMMNSNLGDGAKFPFVALAGRIPVKVVGPVKKGQRLVSSNSPGVARAIDDNQVSACYVSVFGRALSSSDDANIKIIEAVVGVK